MASKGIVNRDQMRRDLNAKYAARRAEIKGNSAVVGDPRKSMNLRGAAQAAAQQQPHRLHNRDVVRPPKATSASSACPASASASSPTVASCPASPNPAGKC